MRQSWSPSLFLTFAFAALTAACTNNSGPGPNGGSCATSSECTGGLVCIVGQCKNRGSVAMNGLCTASRDCAGGLYCAVNGRCLQAGTSSAACIGDQDCTTDLRCDYAGFGGTCVLADGTADVNEPCDRHTDCLAGLYCQAGACTTYQTAFPPVKGADCPADTGPFHSYFEIPRTAKPLNDFFRLPYPNDARVTGRTIDLSGFPTSGPSLLGPDIVKLYLDAMKNDFDGFSTVPTIAYRFNKEINFGQLGQNMIPHFIDLMTDEDFGQAFSYTKEPGQYYCDHFLTLTPDASRLPLVAGRTYLHFLTTDLRSQSGEAITQDPDLAAVLSDTRPTDAELAHAWDAYAGARAWLKAHNRAPSTIANATIFTVADPTAPMKRLAAAVASEPAPVLSGLFQCGTSTGTDPCDDGTSARICGNDENFIEIHGKIGMPIYQKGTEPYEKLADGGALNDEGGKVTKVKNLDVCFGLTLPKSAAPAAGWPLVVYGHGTGGSFRSFIADGQAAKLAQSGIAVFSFDAVGHSVRRGRSSKSPEALVFNVTNPPAARDTALQGAADILTALKLPQSAAPAGWTGPALKFDKLAFFGHSQGSEHAELALPYTDAAPAAVLSGAGAHLIASLTTKTSPVDSAKGIAVLLADPAGFNDSHPMAFIWQNYFDRADPWNYDGLIVQNPLPSRSAKHVLMTWGIGDTYTPNATLATNATALGIPVATPVIMANGGMVARPVSKNVKGVTAAVFQYTPGNFDGHFVAQKNADAIRDWNAFITSFFATGTPTVP